MKLIVSVTGEIKRDGIRVGWIVSDADIGRATWTLRLTPASGRPGIVGTYPLRREARAAAERELLG